MFGSDDCISVRKVALDCLSYHATASDPDTDALTKAPVPSSQVFNLDRWVKTISKFLLKTQVFMKWSHISYFSFLSISYKFNDLLFTDSETFKVVIRMFMDFNLINQYQIPYRVSKTWHDQFTQSKGARVSFNPAFRICAVGS